MGVILSEIDSSNGPIKLEYFVMPCSKLLDVEDLHFHQKLDRFDQTLKSDKVKNGLIHPIIFFFFI